MNTRLNTRPRTVGTVAGLAAAALLTLTAAATFVAAQTAPKSGDTPAQTKTVADKVTRTKAEWRRRLSPEQFHVLREQGTERAGTGKYDAFKGHGVYRCAGCDLPLFSSNTKFDSGTGWPSFYQPLNKNRVRTRTDRDGGMTRTEVICSRCDGHLGHVFNDGPKSTGLRYCMNSVALAFRAAEEQKPGK